MPVRLALVGFVFALALSIAAPSTRATAVSLVDDERSVTTLAAAEKAKPKDDVVNGKDKPKRSKKNDDKDGDPDDGDAGSGNDNKEKPNDGPAND